MIRRPPRSTRTDTLFPYTTLFRSHLASLGLLARPGELYGGPIAIYRMLAICERFAWCRCLKLRQSAFTAQIDRHIVREEIDRDDAVVLAAIGVARLDRWRQHHLHVLGRSEERRVGKGCFSSWSARWCPYHL